MAQKRLQALHSHYKNYLQEAWLYISSWWDCPLLYGKWNTDIIAHLSSFFRNSIQFRIETRSFFSCSFNRRQSREWHFFEDSILVSTLSHSLAKDFLKQLPQIASSHMLETNLNSVNQRKQGRGGGNCSRSSRVYAVGRPYLYCFPIKGLRKGS